VWGVRKLDLPQIIRTTDSNFLWIETGSHWSNRLIPPRGLVTRCNQSSNPVQYLYIIHKRKKWMKKKTLTYMVWRLEKPRPRTKPMHWFSAPANPFPITTARRIATSKISGIVFTWIQMRGKRGFSISHVEVLYVEYPTRSDPAQYKRV